MMEDATIPTAVGSDFIQPQSIKTPRKQPSVRRRNFNSMSPRVGSKASLSPSVTSSSNDQGGSTLHNIELEPKEGFWQSTANTSPKPNMTGIDTSTFNASTTSSVSEFILDNGTSATRERTSSVSSVDSFITSYEPLEVTAGKLKTAANDLRNAEYSLRLSRERVVRLESNLNDLNSIKSKEQVAQSEEIEQLRTALIDSKASHDKLTDELEEAILQLQKDMKEAAEKSAEQKVILSDEVATLESQIDAYTTAHIQEAHKQEDKIAALQAQLESNEATYTREKAALAQEIHRVQAELKTANATAVKEWKEHSEKLSAAASKLQTVIEFKGYLLQSSFHIATNNEHHLERIKYLEKKLTEAEEASLSRSVQLSNVKEEHASLTEEFGNTHRQLEEALRKLESTTQEAVVQKQGNTENLESAETDKVLDELYMIRDGIQFQPDPAETAYLQARVLALEEARVIEVAVISHLFEENTSLRAQVSVLQSEQQVTVEAHSSFEQEALELRNEKEAVVKDNEILTAQLVEIKKLADFAQTQVLRMEQDKSDKLEIVKLLATFKDLQNGTKGYLKNIQDVLNSIQEENAQLVSGELTGLKTFLSEKLGGGGEQSCQTKLTEIESKLRALKDILKKEKLSHDSTRQELASARMKMQLQAAAIDTNAEKISELEDQIEIEQPLVQAGIRARQLWWERSKQCKDSYGRWYSTHEPPNWQIVNSAQAKPDSAADNALFVLGIMTSPRDRSIYNLIYRNPVQSDPRKIALSRQLSAIITMAATLRNRCRLRANFPNEYTDSAQFKAMKQWCEEELDRRMNEAGLDENSSRAEKKVVRDAFDNDATVRTYVLRMKEIFETAMEDFRSLA
ncbi:hypothetical protein BKA64DRAFT_718335 [Cadophora sp. MPI-SDFR-AT-0126]|nr:hypothetical protein BKA64DRAFT_718335 [Leotiomycetes sp. MPI-SDFR-AT-0126]